MPDTGKERGWPERVVLTRQPLDPPTRIWGVVNPDDDANRLYAGHETEPYVPEAALAKARKEGREEVREALEALPRLEFEPDPDHSGFSQLGPKENGRFLDRSAALDSLTKEGS